MVFQQHDVSTMFSLTKWIVFSTALCVFALSPVARRGEAAPLKIVSTAAPVHALIKSLTQGVQQPQLLLAPSVLPHGARLTPSQAAQLQDADLLVFVGSSFAAFESAVEQSATRSIVRLTEMKGIVTLPIFEEHGEHDEHKHDEEGHDQEEHEKEKHEKEEHRREKDHEAKHRVEKGIDPHVWLDIGNARVMVERLAALLIERDRENAALYRKNARALDRSLLALDREVGALVRGLSEHSPTAHSDRFLVLHDATAYFTARYAIRGKERFSVGHHNATRDGVRHTLRVRRGLREGRYRCVVVQPQLPRAVRERFSGGGIRVVEIDPLGVGLVQDRNFYANVLRGVARGFRECLQS